jgi:hypothetical protein
MGSARTVGLHTTLAPPASATTGHAERPTESTEAAKSAAFEGTLKTSSTRTETGQDGVRVAEPLPERPMVPTSAADWESKKQIIWELYMDQNKTLTEVIQIMITKHKFKATYVSAESLRPRSRTTTIC